MTTGLEAFDIPFDGLEARLAELMKEALDLAQRAGEDPEGPLYLPSLDEGGPAIHHMLVRTRQRVDRVQAILATVTQASSRIARARSQAKQTAEEALNQATQTNRLNRGEGSYTSAEERRADANLDAFEQRRRAHQAEMLSGTAETCLTVVKQCYWDLHRFRDDIRDTLKLFQFESMLEHQTSGDAA